MAHFILDAILSVCNHFPIGVEFDCIGSFYLLEKACFEKNITDECEKFTIQNYKKFKECHNHKPQPTPDTKKKRRKTESNVYKTTKQMHEKHIYRQFSLPIAR